MAIRSASVLRRLAALAAAPACLLALAAAPAAHAGTYDVWSCKTPSGTPTSTAGWSPSSSLLYDQPGDDCALGGNLTAKFTGLGGPVSGGLGAGWQFTAPEGTAVAAVRLAWRAAVRAAEGDDGASPRATLFKGASDELAASRLLSCDATGAGCEPFAAGQATAQIGDRSFGFRTACEGPIGRSHCARGAGSRAAIALASARITLSDEALPAGSVTGAALNGKPVRGRAQVRVSATDRGAGIWQAEVRIGPKVVTPRTTLDASGGCGPLPGSKAFGSPQPCPAKAARTLSFDTRDAADGSQLLTVTVWDAANNPTVLTSRLIRVDNARRIKADGTIMMPALEGTVEQQLFSAGGGSKRDGGLRPDTLSTDPALMPILSAMDALADAQIPYCYGGGHGTTPAVPSAGSYCWQGKPAQKVTGSGAVGLDCSSSLSWVLQQSGYQLPTITSGQFAGIGDAGEGQRMTIWANGGHVYVEVKVGRKSYYWGTASENPEHGPGWHKPRSSAGFTARHLPGL